MAVATEPVVRSEIQVAADTVAALIAGGMIGAHLKDEAGAKVGLMPGEVQAALNRRQQVGFIAPRRNPVPQTLADLAPDLGPPRRDANWSPEAKKCWEQGCKRGAQKGGAIRSRQPKSGQDEMTCPKCGNTLDIEQNFALRPDRPGRRWTTCNGCRRTRSKDRYLDVGKERALSMARLTFVICEDDLTVGLGCLDCGEAFVVGDDVTGAAQLTHVVCPVRP